MEVAFEIQHFPQACILNVPHLGRNLVELWVRRRQILANWQISSCIFSEISSDGSEKEKR